MILIDTSIWIDHLRKADQRLLTVLNASLAATHPFVLGEIALGSLKDRRRLLGDLAALPMVEVATDDEVLSFIDSHDLAGSGVGYLDAHLLAGVKLTPGARLWSKDRKLCAAADRLGLAMTARD